MKSFHRIAGLAVAGLQFVAAAQGQEQPYSFHYFKEERPLELETSQIVVRFRADVPPDQQARVLAQAGLDAAAKRPGAIPMPLAGWQAPSVDPAKGSITIEQRIAVLSGYPDIEFAGPVFRSESGGAMVVMPRLMVRFPAETPVPEALAILGRVAPGAAVELEAAGLKNAYRVVPVERNGFAVLALANALASRTDTLWAEPDFLLEAEQQQVTSFDDPLVDDAWALDNNGQQQGWVAGIDMDVVTAWRTSTGSPGVTVAVFDDGVQSSHPDLANVIGVDLTGQGSNGEPGSGCDTHGTRVAGVIGATINNGQGSAGVAPMVRLASVRMFLKDGTNCSRSGVLQSQWVADGLAWARQRGARVACHGYTISASSTTVTDAMNSAAALGMMQVASAGNGSGTSLAYPASIPSVVSVTSVGPNGIRSSFASYGTGLDFAAPGENAVATMPTTSGTSYVFTSGTSFAAPHAAGVAALVFSVRPDFDVPRTLQVMQATARDLGPPGVEVEYGHGMPNAAAAIALAMDTVQFPTGPSQLINISTRARVGAGANVLIAGFIIEGTESKQVLIKGLGRGLAAFAVPGTLANSQLRLFSAQTMIGENNDWAVAPNVDAVVATGRAPSEATDAAILRTLAPGTYTVHLSDATGPGGNGLVEVWDVAGNSKLTNISTRGFVGSGDEVMIAGFIVQGSEARRILVTGWGQGLESFGVPGTLDNARLRLFSGQTQIAENDNWQATQAAEIAATTKQPPAASDAALILTLMPGPYTAHLLGAANGTGTGLVEVYDLGPAATR